MKATFYLLLFVFFYSCSGSNDTKGWATDDMLVKPNPYAAGEKVYMASCVACHQKTGVGLEGAFPPLANSDYLMADKNRAILIAANGMSGEIVVNGESYNSTMAPQGLSNEAVRDVMNYVLNSWGNDGGEVTLEEVEAALAN